MENEEKKKNKKKVSVLTLVLSLVFAVLMSVFVTAAFILGVEKQTHRGMYQALFRSGQEESSELAQIGQLYYVLKDNYVGKVDEQKLIDGALRGMTEALDDPYSNYMSGEEMKALNDSISGSFEGIGAVMTLDKNQPMVAEPPIKDSPASKAGLQAKDVILKVDDEEVAGKPLNEVVTKVRGKKGTDVKLTVQRGDKVFDVKITRDEIPVDSVESKIDKDNPTVGLITIKSFGKKTSDEFNQAIEKLRKDGAKSFVIDVRGNPGGLLDQVEKIASRFLKNGKPIIQFENKEGEKQVDRASKELDGGNKIKEPVVILVDGNSASASEILAAALNQSADVPVIGTKTFGKGTVQTVVPMSTSSELKLTTLKWLTPDGTWIHKKGLKPTIEKDYPSYARLHPLDKDKTYKLGDAGEEINTLDQMLAALGYLKGEVSNIYNEETVEAVKEFQAQNQIEVTGTADRATTIAIEKKLIDLINSEDPAYKEAVKVLLENK